MRVVLDTNILVSSLLVQMGHPETIGSLPRVERSPDPDDDDSLRALSEAGKAAYLATGDKSGLLSLTRHEGARIVSARDFAALFA